MEFIDVIRARRAIRSFRPDAIPKAALRQILEAGRLAPSGGNAQNWYFGVVTDATLKEQLARAAGQQMWIASAPVVLALCADISFDLKEADEDNFALTVNHCRFGEPLVDYCNAYPDRRAMNLLWHNAAGTTAGQQMYLAAVDLGLGACWVGYLDIAQASKLLQLPDHVACLFLMPIGYPAEVPEDIERKSIDQIVFRDRWAGS